MDQPIPADIHFQCQRCTNCCRWPGDVKVSDAEILEIANFLQRDEDEFIRDFTHLRKDRQGLSLIEKPNGECVFLEGNNCAIQPVKPVQCAGFPNTWNFPGWRNHCEATPMKRLPNGSLVGLTEEQLRELHPHLARS